MSIPQLKPFQSSEIRTTSSASLKKKLSAVLSSCRICLSSVFEPACLTNCGHSFCEECLNTFWHVNNKPNYIVCPLCRGQASNIAFILKDDASSTKDLRKTFNIDERDVNESLISLGDPNCINQSTLCLKMMLIPALYCVYNWLKDPILQLVAFFQTMFKIN